VIVNSRVHETTSTRDVLQPAVALCVEKLNQDGNKPRTNKEVSMCRETVDVRHKAEDGIHSVVRNLFASDKLVGDTAEEVHDDTVADMCAYRGENVGGAVAAHGAQSKDSRSDDRIAHVTAGDQQLRELVDQLGLVKEDVRTDGVLGREDDWDRVRHITTAFNPP
jgi:hypothetical protein